MSDSLALYESKSNPTRFSIQVFVPTNCDEIRLGFQVKVENIGAVLVVDDFEGSSNPFVYKDLLEIQSYEITQDNLAMSNVSSEAEFNLATASISNEGANLITVEDDSSNTRTKFIANKKRAILVAVIIRRLLVYFACYVHH